jgi:hypothetical protein
MMTIKEYLDFWNKDLIKIKPSEEVRDYLAPSAILFLTQYGLPSNNRIYWERKTFLEQTTHLPKITLHGKNIEGNIRRQYPYFEFESSLFAKFVFQGQEFVRIGVEDDRDIAIEVRSGNIRCIDHNLPLDSWPADLQPPTAQNLFVNSGMEELGLSLTAEFLAKRKLILPRKKYVNASRSKNTGLRFEAEKEINQIVNDLETELKTIDHPTFEAADSYWIYYFLQARYPG